ncbi:carboxylesterase family protein [Demequina zhanjiangensis]|uniref:Carboxylic ester hydrolase n=1 Tax=Demequina zhanjiangensis TaxID=3051659 RepID=A0ABT8G1F8_9MICO|nr:carboxylesterase family protein [Demequina sp. SYSU T00b26]MDN4472975.1 carboxylesterase family protein [Demequina sp. SYSU T00b26]
MPDSAVRRVDTALGPVLAHRDGDLWRARGIPYAVAERFQRPSPVSPWRKPFDASAPAPVSPQHADGLMGSVSPDYLERLGTDEQCQRVSVTWPSGTGDAPLPVVVWIHGGSYLTGGGDLDGFDPALLVREQRVIVVSVTYRLGLLGWLGDGDFAPANLGLMDMIEALRWVRTCIEGFGGDTSKVTVMGQSAGGDAIAALMAVPEARGLFRRAIVQSAPLGIGDRRGAMQRTMLRTVRPVDPTMSLDQVLDANEEIYRATRKHGLKGLMPYGPQWGRYPLPPESKRADATALAHDVDLLLGHMSDEGVLVGAALPPLGKAFRAPVVGGAVQHAVAGSLQAAVYEKAAAHFVEEHRAAGGNAIHYVLGWKATGSPIADGHGMDIPVLLGDPDAWVEADGLKHESPDRIRRVGVAVRQAWGDFVRDGRISRESADAASEWLTLS